MNDDVLLRGDKDKTILRLWDDREKLIARLRNYQEMQVGPPPAIEGDYGYQVWSALMEDLRAEGRMRLKIKHVTVLNIAYEAIPSVSVVAEISDPSPSGSAGNLTNEGAG